MGKGFLGVGQAMLSSSLVFRFSVGAAFGLGLFIGTVNSARSEVKPAVTNSLLTKVNGRLDGSCRSGICKITGGTSSGRNLFHRFKAFDTRGDIDRVEFDSFGNDNLIIGVTAPNGSFIDKSIGLSAPANLFWLSPGGIHLDQGSSFVNAPNLILSTANTLHLAVEVLMSSVASPCYFVVNWHAIVSLCRFAGRSTLG